MSNPLDTIKEGLKTSTADVQPSKINLKEVGETVKEISDREPFRVTSIVFFRDEPTE
jgi:hypothetical protein